jgi:hypothetical protein
LVRLVVVVGVVTVAVLGQVLLLLVERQALVLEQAVLAVLAVVRVIMEVLAVRGHRFIQAAVAEVLVTVQAYALAVLVACTVQAVVVAHHQPFQPGALVLLPLLLSTTPP